MPRTWRDSAPGQAKRRSRRMRKKLKIQEFQELGFLIRAELQRALTDDAQLDLTERLIVEVLAPRGLQMGGSLRDAYVARRSPGSASAADLSAVRDWFSRQRGIDWFDVGPLSDAWYDGPDEHIDATQVEVVPRKTDETAVAARQYRLPAWASRPQAGASCALKDLSVCAEASDGRSRRNDMSTDHVEVVQGSTNVYADLGYRNSAAMKRKSKLVIEMTRRINARGLSPTDAAQLLGVDVNLLTSIRRGRFCKVSERRLLELLTRLES